MDVIGEAICICHKQVIWLSQAIYLQESRCAYDVFLMGEVWPLIPQCGESRLSSYEILWWAASQDLSGVTFLFGLVAARFLLVRLVRRYMIF